KARAEADLREREANDAEEKAKNLLEEKLLIEAKPGITKKEKQETNDAAVAAKADAEKARTIATHAQEKWYKLACDYHSIFTVAQQKESASTTQTGIDSVRALNKLQQADQAVNNLWAEVSTLYDETERHEDDFLLQEQQKKEAEQYSIKLLAKKETDIAECFGKVQKKLEDAKKEYNRNTNESRAKAQRLYEEAGQLEESARQDYVQKMESDALAHARKRTPGAMEAWLRRVTDSEGKKTQEANRVIFKAPCKDSWTDETKRLFERLEAIEAADKKAFKIFRDEETRLNDIATIWTAIIESKRRILERAVKSYREDPTIWEMLHSEEREKYNREIREENNAREDVINANLKEAEELAEKLRQKADAAWSINWNKTAIEKAAQEAEAELAELETEEKERQDAIALANFLTKGKAQAKQTAKRAQVAREQYTKNNEEKNLWNCMASRYEHASASYCKALESLTQGNTSIALRLFKNGKQYEKGAEDIKHAINTGASENNINSLVKADISDIYHSYERLTKAVEYTTNATALLGSENQEIVDLWIEAAKISQDSADFYDKANKARTALKDEEAQYSNDIGHFAGNAADLFAQAINARLIKNEKAFDYWYQAALTTQAAGAYRAQNSYVLTRKIAFANAQSALIPFFETARAFIFDPSIQSISIVANAAESFANAVRTIRKLVLPKDDVSLEILLRIANAAHDVEYMARNDIGKIVYAMRDAHAASDNARAAAEEIPKVSGTILEEEARWAAKAADGIAIIAGDLCGWIQNQYYNRPFKPQSEEALQRYLHKHGTVLKDYQYPQTAIDLGLSKSMWSIIR
ncbi:MAG TPA: hypothetical protein VJK54_09675, partial [Chthoniobacterales bacterium]|nr:hypothetical protein [Chthoniobacterales bacterium]